MKTKKTLTVVITITIIIFLCIGLVSFTIAGDDPVINKIATQLSNWLDNNPIEKTYLQTDKPYYCAGDDIWFKAYITINNKHQLSALSGSVNIELIDERDSVKKWIKVPVINGLGWGDFKLPDTLNEGNYRIRAYTNWMRNAGPDYYFDKVINIGNAATNTVYTKSNYTYTTVNNEQKVNAVINYSDINGAPYSGKTVNYKVQFNDKFIARGKGITDNTGNLKVNFINPERPDKGSIITDIKLDEKNKIIKTIAVNATSGKVDVQFFPEGGNLVNGIHSVVAFKAVGENGLGTNIKGTILDNENKAVAEFATQHLGMGVFAITPQNGGKYKARITYADGSQNTINLPAALNSGYVLHINDTDPDNIKVNVMGTNDLTNTGHMYLFAQSGGEPQYVASNNTGGHNFSATMSKNKFPSGIVQFTLFSANGDPLNERIAFIQHPDDGLKLNVSTKPVSVPREKIKIDIGAQKTGDKPVIGSFSVAVIDESKVPVNESDETTILSHTLLTSDLKGYIEQPNYYFDNTNDATNANLDLLMLTQGYRRFEWKPLLAGALAQPVYQPEKLIQIAGAITTLGGKPVPNAKVTLFTNSGGLFVLDSVTNTQGRFAFKNLIIKDSVRFVLQARTAKNSKNVNIVLDDNGKNDIVVKSKYLSAIKFNDWAPHHIYLEASKKLYNEELKYGLGDHNIMVKEVIIREKRKPLVSESSSNLNGAGNADQVITTEMLNKMLCPSIDVCLQTLAHGVLFNNGKAYLTRTPHIAMQVMVDGMPYDDLSSINPSDIGSIEVLKSIEYTAIYGSKGNGGLLIITTRRGDEAPYPAVAYTPGMLIYKPKGYYVSRRFYSPQYDDPKLNKAEADLRTTVYWNPNIITDQSGHASFEYYNAGNAGNYRVVVEGIDNDGNLGRKVYHYKVQ